MTKKQKPAPSHLINKMIYKELLELAAKAAEIDGEYVENYNGDFYYQGNTEGILNKTSFYVWNPLEDDGDALRLAVKLRLEVEWWKNGVEVNHPDIPPCPIHNTEDDPYAATRRAIVRAAAEIGKAMP